jgi:molybdate transport system substrate-binding protein
MFSYMGKNSRLFLMIIFLLLFAVSCNTGDKNGPSKLEATEITISAAASLQEALNEVKIDFEKKHKNIDIALNFGGSGILQQQIVQGAPVDLFISASEEKFNALISKGLIDSKLNIDLLGNELVLITNKNSDTHIQSFEDLLSSSISKVAIGTPESVPAGLYAKQALEKLGIWSDLQTKLILAKDVRQVLTYVETGNVDAGIVYITDAKTSDKVDMVANANEKLHEPIIYPTGIVKTSVHIKEATLFLEYLKKEHSRNIFKKYGFRVLD